MRRSLTALAACCLAALLAHPPRSHAQRPIWSCANPEAIGVERVVEIDAAKGHVYGSVTSQPSPLNILRPREVVLTFDDGPYPGLTEQILDTLEQHCTKATFFVVGQMAVAHPEILRRTLAQGHTIGTHTWSHPLGVRRQPYELVVAEIERGFAATAKAAQAPIAPFFRFPGLGDGTETVAYLKSRGIATFAVDVISNDSFLRDPRRVVQRTMSILAEKGSGIILFHDIKASTAQALPLLLEELHRLGYKVVHLRPKAPYRPDPLAQLMAGQPQPRAPGEGVLGMRAAFAGVPAPVPHPLPVHVKPTPGSAADDRPEGSRFDPGSDATPAIRAALAAQLGLTPPRLSQPIIQPEDQLEEPWLKASVPPFHVLEADPELASR